MAQSAVSSQATFSLKTFLTAAVIGAFGGFLGGLVGVGGGIIMVPLMVSYLRLTQHQAIATSLGVVLIVGTSGASVYLVRGDWDWLTVIGLAAGGIVGAYIGARAMARLSADRLRLIFSIVMLAVGMKFVFFP